MPPTCRQLTPRSHSTKIYLCEEAAYGVYQEGQTPVYVPVSSESIRPSHKQGGTRHSIESGSSPQETGSTGRMDLRGDILTEFATNGWGPLLLKHATSSSVSSTTGEGGFDNHASCVGPGSLLPVGMSIDKVFQYPDGTIYNIRNLGCRIDNLTLRFGLNLPVSMRAQWIGKDYQRLTAGPASSRSYPSDPVMKGNDFTVALDINNDGTAEAMLGVVRGEFTIANGLGGGSYGIEAAGVKDRVPQGKRTVFGRLETTFLKAHETIMDRWINNDPIGMMLSGVVAGDSNQFAHFGFSAVRLRGTPVPQVSGRGPAKMDFSFIAEVGDDDCQFEWEVQNLESGVHTGAITRNESET